MPCTVSLALCEKVSLLTRFSHSDGQVGARLGRGRSTAARAPWVERFRFGSGRFRGRQQCGGGRFDAAFQVLQEAGGRCTIDGPMVDG